MRPFALLFLLAGACTSTATPEPEEPAPQEDPSASDDVRPFSDKANAAVAWRSAWVVGQSSVVPGAEDGGRLFDTEGLRLAEREGDCGSSPRFQGSAQLWLPGGDVTAFQAPPMVSAATVERAAWRLAEVLGPPKGVLPGVQSKDPTLHQGIRVRAVNKLRRAGPPWQAIVGEREDRVGVAIADAEAGALSSGVVLRRSSDAPVELGVTTGGDVDGDGSPDLVVVGDGPEGSFRAVISVKGHEGEARVLSFEEQPELACE